LDGASLPVIADINIAARSRIFSRLLSNSGRVFFVASLVTLLPIITGGSEGGDGKAQTAAPLASKPRRIVSICMQGDQLLLQLAPRERIAALSRLAADPDTSAHWEAARGIPTVHFDAEEIFRLKPDLVLVSPTSPLLTVEILKRLGVPVLELGIPTDFDELRDQIRLAGRSLGEEARAEEIVRAMDARLDRLKAGRPPEAKRPTALFYFQGYTTGAHTFPNAILEAAGFRNLASTLGSGEGISTSLESIIMARPQYLILTRFREGSPTATQLSETQPVFRKLGAQTKVISVSIRDLVSPDPSNVELAEMLQGCLHQ
jgi:iron complex transport system substrate-binding protein